jgi:hypothetical protein
MVLTLRYIGTFLLKMCPIRPDFGTDRTGKLRRQRIEINKQQRAHWKAQKRTSDALPKRVSVVIETGKALVTEAKGLGRGRGWRGRGVPPHRFCRAGPWLMASSEAI